MQSEGVNPAKAMWKASQFAQKNRRQADKAANSRGRGSFAASAAAMYKDAGKNENQEGVGGVVSAVNGRWIDVATCPARILVRVGDAK